MTRVQSIVLDAPRCLDQLGSSALDDGSGVTLYVRNLEGGGTLADGTKQDRSEEH